MLCIILTVTSNIKTLIGIQGMVKRQNHPFRRHFTALHITDEKDQAAVEKIVRGNYQTFVHPDNAKAGTVGLQTAYAFARKSLGKRVPDLVFLMDNDVYLRGYMTQAIKYHTANPDLEMTMEGSEISIIDGRIGPAQQDLSAGSMVCTPAFFEKLMEDPKEVFSSWGDEELYWRPTTGQYVECVD